MPPRPPHPALWDAISSHSGEILHNHSRVQGLVDISRLARWTFLRCKRPSRGSMTMPSASSTASFARPSAAYIYPLITLSFHFVSYVFTWFLFICLSKWFFLNSDSRRRSARLRIGPQVAADPRRRFQPRGSHRDMVRGQLGGRDGHCGMRGGMGAKMDAGRDRAGIMMGSVMQG